ncbi:MAG TPA: hypothetical protein VEA59_00345 [Patescibacteria group bacterium]|nr:hypothetical protein [Patescibacteria group bacterium]
MKTLKDLLNNSPNEVEKEALVDFHYKQKGRELNFVNERQVVVQDFVDKINVGRIGTKFKPVTWSQINGLTSHLKGFELKHFYQECSKKNNFSSYFFWSLKKR